MIILRFLETGLDMYKNEMETLLDRKQRQLHKRLDI
jgi:hypothetical protein